MKTVKAYAAPSAGSALAPFTVERREVQEDDVCIEIQYCGVCHSDIHQAHDGWGGGIFPMVPGHEIVGLVTEVGKAVTQFKKNDRVGVGCFVDGGASLGACDRETEQYDREHLVLTYNSYEHDKTTPTFGGYSKAITVKQDYVLKIPDNLSLAEAAPLLCAGITTYSPLVHWGAGPGKEVAILGLGGLGHVAVKIAKAMGAKVTVLSHSTSKKQDAHRLGATDYYATSEEQVFSELANRFDLIINTVGSPIDWNAYVGLLSLDGTMVQVGIPEQPIPVNAFPLIGARRSISGSLIGSIPETQRMLNFCGEHGITADIEVIPIQYINEAFQRVENSDVHFRFVIKMESLG